MREEAQWPDSKNTYYYRHVQRNEGIVPKFKRSIRVYYVRRNFGARRRHVSAQEGDTKISVYGILSLTQYTVLLEQERYSYFMSTTLKNGNHIDKDAERQRKLKLQKSHLKWWGKVDFHMNSTFLWFALLPFKI